MLTTPTKLLGPGYSPWRCLEIRAFGVTKVNVHSVGASLLANRNCDFVKVEVAHIALNLTECFANPVNLFDNNGSNTMSSKERSEKERRTVPVEAIELYNQYVHGEISRRTFLNRAKQFVVAGLTAGALVEALMPNYAMGQQIARDAHGRRGTSTRAGQLHDVRARCADLSGRLSG